MLTALLPEDVVEYWPVVKVTIEQALATSGPIFKSMNLNKVLEAAIAGEIICWAVSEDGKIVGFILTNIEQHHFSDSKLLNIFFVHMQASSETWADGYVNIAKYAKSKDCKYITGYVRQPNAINVAKSFGSDVECRYIVKEIEDEIS
jgi:hypothetical protein